MKWQIIAFVLSLAIAYLLTPWVRRTAIRLNVMVHPGGRRVHTRPMPLWGGLAIYAAFVVTILALTRLVGNQSSLSTPVLGIIIASSIIMIVGLLDDMKEFSAVVQSFAILLASIILASFGVRVQFLSDPFHHKMIVLSPTMSWAFTLIWLFLVTKTFDFMDGLDGLASGIGAISSGVLALTAYYSGYTHVALIAATLSGACVGFLRFNFNPAKIFMGTGGSQFVGFILASISIVGALKSTAAIAIGLPVLVLGVPIFDGIYVIIRRLMKGQAPYVADRTHLHHRLVDRGLTHKQAVFVIYSIILILGTTALVWLFTSRQGGLFGR